jgi:hypothetical protein
MLTASEIERMFSRTDGSYVFARWSRPICPVVFGVQDETLVIMKSAIEAVCIAVGHRTDELDPELGSNLMMFFFSDWEELRAVPDLDQMIPQLENVCGPPCCRAGQSISRFRFDDQGAIQACFVFLRVDEALQQLGADSLALSQAVQAMFLWSQEAFKNRSPLAVLDNGTTVMRPEIAALLRAGYDPVMPACAKDASHALRLAARIEGAQ